MLSFQSIRRNRVITFLCFSSYYYDFFVIFCSLKPADYAGMGLLQTAMLRAFHRGARLF